MMNEPPKQQRVYVKNTYLPFEEDETHEFKGHRNIAIEDLPEWVHHMTPDYRQSRKSVSRNLNGFLNTGAGGTVYLGVDDGGRVLGLHLTRFQKDHVLLSVRDTLRRYRPPVAPERYTVTFVPVVPSEGAAPLKEYRYDSGQRRKPHRVATSAYCWCEAECKARAHQGQIPMDYVVEITVLSWSDPIRLHPFHLTESGSCYIRRSASLAPLTALDVVQLTHHQAAALMCHQEAALMQRLSELLDAGHRDAPDDGFCRCDTRPLESASSQTRSSSADSSCSLIDSGVDSVCSLLGDLRPTSRHREERVQNTKLEEGEPTAEFCESPHKTELPAVELAVSQPLVSRSGGTVPDFRNNGEAVASAANVIPNDSVPLSDDGPVIDIATRKASVVSGNNTDVTGWKHEAHSGTEALTASVSTSDAATEAGLETDAGADDSGIGVDTIGDLLPSPATSRASLASQQIAARPRGSSRVISIPELVGTASTCGPRTVETACSTRRVQLRRPFLSFSSWWDTASREHPAHQGTADVDSDKGSDCGSEDSWGADYRPAAAVCP